MPDCLVAVATIDMQQVEAAIGELFDGVVEAGPQQAREASVAGIVEGGEICEDLLGVEAGLPIASPGIDCRALCRQPACPDRLAERRIGDAVMRAQFDQAARLQRLYEPERERDVAVPSAHDARSGRYREQRVLCRVGQPLDCVVGQGLLRGYARDDHRPGSGRSSQTRPWSQAPLTGGTIAPVVTPTRAIAGHRQGGLMQPKIETWSGGGRR